ncbi:unnamed protein product [Periconia digitata]|uniref:Uncharacterized protein n=1 Tax=Periconia digitata TaxID=1303443 RepID=A0A9W4U977_9PLEO|nr:unnamed protein product [Periconia digitata]
MRQMHFHISATRGGGNNSGLLSVNSASDHNVMACIYLGMYLSMYLCMHVGITYLSQLSDFFFSLGCSTSKLDKSDQGLLFSSPLWNLLLSLLFRMSYDNCIV